MWIGFFYSIIVFGNYNSRGCCYEGEVKNKVRNKILFSSRKMLCNLLGKILLLPEEESILLLLAEKPVNFAE